MFEKYAKTYFKDRDEVLEIGPDRFPSSYRGRVEASIGRWDTLDIHDDPRLTFPGSDPYSFAIDSGRYDVVLACNVAEHVARVWVWIKELARVCKPGGLVITINPLSWPYHEAPIDCWRMYPEGMKALYEEAGLRVIRSEFESLEARRHRRSIPGMNLEMYLERRGRVTRGLYKILDAVGFPMMCAYDTATIGIKGMP